MNIYDRKEASVKFVFWYKTSGRYWSWNRKSGRREKVAKG
jgi:hypothetical protein